MKLDPKYLKTICVEVIPELAYKFDQVAEKMLQLCYNDKGEQIAVGLAANQCGLDIRMIVIDYAGFKGCMINPVISKFRGGLCTAREGCLSFPELFAWPERYKIIVVNYLDESGKQQKGKYRGLMARIIQHEIDHLNGIDMFEREELNHEKEII